MLKFMIPVLLLGLSACSSVELGPSSNNNVKDGSGSFITGRSEGGITLDDFSGKSNNTTGLPVNALLWRASLDIVSVLPIDDIDAFGGSILTDWYSLPEKSGERIKLAVFILDKELRSDAIRVIVYTQTLIDSSWGDAGLDTALASKLEDLILTRARELRAPNLS